VVEETLRQQGPVMYLPLRCALEDIDLGEGVVIRKGEAVIIAFAAAGRDPEVHPGRPDDFDPGRASKEHLAFAYGGVRGPAGVPGRGRRTPRGGGPRGDGRAWVRPPPPRRRASCRR
jgi:Cytochrome P450